MADRSEDRRVKFYVCNEDGQWDDQGTGHVGVQQGANGAWNMIVRSEEGADSTGRASILLNTPVSMNDIYGIQGETLLVWEDAFMSQHLALSFQSSTGCQAHFEQIKAIREGRAADTDTDDDEEDEDISAALSEPEIRNLGTVHQALVKVSALPPYLRREMVGKIARSGCLEKLFAIFDQCEDLDDLDSLHIIFKIFTAILLLNDMHLFSLLFEGDFLVKLIGCLEYDPIYNRRIHHRVYLNSGAPFNEVVPLKPALKKKIHDTFRLQYLKDTVIARHLDDSTASTLNGILSGRQSDIISEVCVDDDFMDCIVRKLSESTTKEKQQVLRLCQEMHTLARALPPSGKAEFLFTLCAQDVLKQVGELLVSDDLTVRRLALDVVGQSCQQEPGVLRKYLIKEEEKGHSCNLLFNLVSCLVCPAEDSVKVELVEILKQLLETGQRPGQQILERAVTTSAEEMAILLELFYDQCCPTLISPLLKDEKAFPGTVYHILDMLSFCVSQHNEHAKKQMLQNSLIGKVIGLLEGKKCSLQLAAAIARFVKAVVMCKDEQYNKYIAKNNCFASLVKLFLANVGKDNLFYSTFLSVCEVLKREAQKSKLLIGYMVDSFPEELLPLAPKLDSIKGLKLHWEHTREKDKAMFREVYAPKPKESESYKDPLAAMDAKPTSPISPGVSLVAYGVEEELDSRAAKKRRVEGNGVAQS